MRNGRLIMGKHCIEEVLKSDPGRLIAVYTAKDNINDPLLKEVVKHRVPLKYLSKHELTSLVQSDSHQSYIAEVHEKHSRTLNDFLEDEENTAVLALDNINDPHNLGTIIRAAVCFGVDAVTFSKNRGADLTPVASKASVGGTELIEVLKVSNLAETVKKFKEYHYRIIAADISQNAISLYDYTFPEKFLLVMGSEGEGIQKLIMRYVDDVVYIPMSGNIDSLNVSQATAVFLAKWRGK